MSDSLVVGCVVCFSLVFKKQRKQKVKSANIPRSSVRKKMGFKKLLQNRRSVDIKGCDVDVGNASVSLSSKISGWSKSALFYLFCTPHESLQSVGQKFRLQKLNFFHVYLHTILFRLISVALHCRLNQLHWLPLKQCFLDNKYKGMQYKHPFPPSLSY